MNLKKIILIFAYVISLYSCADYNVNKVKHKKVKQYYSSSGFALIYEDNLYKKKILNKKINNEEIKVMHNLLKMNTAIRIINPANSKVIETKIYKKVNYPKIFTIVVSKKIASILELDLDNPFVEVIEVKKNKTFIAKKTNTYEEEKNVAEKAPVDKIKMDSLTNNKGEVKKKVLKKNNFIILINDYYYEDSAINLKNELLAKTGFSNILVKKISNNKYRLLAGPFKNFNALKTTYISLNNLGFEDLNIYKN
tara:strand:- start:307 stop:1062 length:756 start_codon:yes stop_codon:yes gene_type:complete